MRKRSDLRCIIFIIYIKFVSYRISNVFPSLKNEFGSLNRRLYDLVFVILDRNGLGSNERVGY